ncbi:MAG: hypothetical protein LBB83_12555 [Treponema sp.]|jgi:hypothetical protein|nr:hypothetical protein [Treponema sp.]
MEHKQTGDENTGDKRGKPAMSSITDQLEENSRYRDSPNKEAVFYYSRERRLERASEAVRAINEPGPAMRGGILRVLFATRAGTLLFITIVILCVFILFFYYIRGRPELKIGGNSISISALRYSGKTYVEIKKKALGDDFYTGTVDLALSIPQRLIEGEKEAPIANQRIFFTLEEDEEFRFSLPFDAPELILLMQAGNEIRTFRIGVIQEAERK